MRAFFAVPADPVWVERARSFVEALRPRLPRASWTKPESWHVTLKFLGEIPDEAAERFAAQIGTAAGELAAGDLVAADPVLLPPGKRPRVVAVGFRPGGTLATLERLARAAESAALAIGCPAEGRPFRPHVTLARMRESWSPAAVDVFEGAAASWTLPPWRVTSCVLFRSRLDPAGAIHTPVRSWEAAEAAKVLA